MTSILLAVYFKLISYEQMYQLVFLHSTKKEVFVFLSGDFREE